MENTSQRSKRTFSCCPNPDTLSKCRGSRLTKCFQVVSPIGHVNSGGDGVSARKRYLDTLLDKGILQCSIL